MKRLRRISCATRLSSKTRIDVSTPRQQLIRQYRDLLDEVYGTCAESTPPVELPPEIQLQSWWAAGLLPHEGCTVGHGEVKILESGRWNRGPGADFTHAEIELNGERRRGDIEIDPCAQDWERHGHGANPGFNNVVLHVVLTPPPAGWYTRNSLHQEIPVLYLPPEAWKDAEHKRCSREDNLPLCRRPLAEMNAARIEHLLQAAAAYRMELKRTQFRRRAERVGDRQAWYEAWATCLGYSANKNAMQMLAMRAPIKELGSHAEAVLLGTAGFLVPVLPERSGEDARLYHRSVWDAWWLLREQFELSEERHLPWSQAPARPMNHPQRRVAALACSIARWQRIMPLLNAAGARELTALLTGISHPFWDTHYTLSSAPMPRRAALIGKQRVDDFLINYVYALDESAHAWHSYLAIGAGAPPGGVQRTAGLLFGERADLQKTLRKAYAQQALLQIDCDFCARNICMDCAFPAQLSDWAQ